MPNERRDVIRSQNAIKSAYLKLSLAKPTQKITIQEVIDAANVSRGTFYAHFSDIYGLRQAVEDELLTSWKAIIAKEDMRKFSKDPYHSLLRFYNYFKNTFRLMPQDEYYGANPGYFEKMKSILVEALCPEIDDSRPQKYMSAICIASIIGDTCFDMICHTKSPYFNKPEEVARYVSDCLSRGAFTDQGEDSSD